MLFPFSKGGELKIQPKYFSPDNIVRKVNNALGSSSIWTYRFFFDFFTAPACRKYQQIFDFKIQHVQSFCEVHEGKKGENTMRQHSTHVISFFKWRLAKNTA